ncbi:hypothetical protein [Robinsoniella sp. KNHs210]|uniref:hypothetical protein n=1 Tax=Robinsoniella sp. KNHs210 TaxID=1469950 RepID=UPI000488165F|nr:hypothetical protein [Robinsoniella sp. KNHs210]
MNGNDLFNVIESGTPVRFYGPGLGKSTICRRLRELGYENVSECGDDDICDGQGCMSVPKDFSGMLVYFEDNPGKVNLPELMKIIGLEIEEVQKDFVLHEISLCKDELEVIKDCMVTKITEHVGEAGYEFVQIVFYDSQNDCNIILSISENGAVHISDPV